MNRLAIYVYWDREGIVRDFAIDTIRKYSEFFDRVVVVVNGELAQKSLKELDDFPVDVHVRANEGYDFGAYKAGLNFVGWDELRTFDQVVLANSSVYGPIFPLSEMFGEMEKREVDFWGVTQYSNQYEAWPDHLQSYFLVFQKKTLVSDEFRKYWNELPLFSNAIEAISQGETQLTTYFHRLGFKYDSYINIESFKERSPDCCYFYGHELLQLRSPFLKRKIFSNEGMMRCFLDISVGDQGMRVIKALQKETDYDIHLIYDDLLKTAFCSSIREGLGLTYVLPTQVLQTKVPVKTKKVALLFYVYFADLIAQCCRYIESMPLGSTVVIVSPKEEILEKYKRHKFEGQYQMQYRLHPNRGRGEAAILVTCRDLLNDFDFICCMHDKKMINFRFSLLGETMMEHNLRSLLDSKIYVQNVLHLFESNQQLGLLMPAEPIFIKAYLGLVSDPWGGNGDISHDLIKKMGLKVALDPNAYFPVGGMFWLRKNVAKSFFTKDWKLEDFPEEPMATNGTVNHALERLTPLIAQAGGYFSAVIIPDGLAGPYYSALEFRLKDTARQLIGLRSDPTDTVTFVQYKQVSKIFFRRKIKEYLVKIGLFDFARKIWRQIYR